MAEIQLKIGRFILLYWHRYNCWRGKHDLYSVPSAPGYFKGGIFGAKRCRWCDYTHCGFPTPDWSDML